MNSLNKQRGFSLIECVIAIALLATVVGSMISMQGTIVRILQFSNEKEKAGIELNSIFSQFEFLVNSQMQKKLPKPGNSIEWNAKWNNFKNKISIQKSDVKISHFLLSAFNLYYMDSEDDKPNTDLLKPIGEMLDTQIAIQLIEPVILAENSVSWLFGKETKTSDIRMFLINTAVIDQLNINLP